MYVLWKTLIVLSFPRFCCLIKSIFSKATPIKDTYHKGVILGLRSAGKTSPEWIYILFNNVNYFDYLVKENFHEFKIIYTYCVSLKFVLIKAKIKSIIEMYYPIPVVFDDAHKQRSWEVTDLACTMYVPYKTLIILSFPRFCWLIKSIFSKAAPAKGTYHKGVTLGLRPAGKTSPSLKYSVLAYVNDFKADTKHRYSCRRQPYWALSGKIYFNGIGQYSRGEYKRCNFTYKSLFLTNIN